MLRSDESGARHQAIGTQRRGLPPRGCDGRPFRSQPHVRRRFHRGDAPRNEAAARHPPDGRTPPPDHGGDGHPSRRPDFAARRTGGTAARAGESRPGARSAFRTGGESLHAGRGADALSRRDRMGDPDARPTRFRRSEAHRRHPRQSRCRTPLPRRTRPPRNGNFGRRVGKLRTRPPHARHGRLDLRRRDGRHLPQGNDPRRKYPALPTGNKIART